MEHDQETLKREERRILMHDRTPHADLLSALNAHGGRMFYSDLALKAGVQNTRMLAMSLRDLRQKGLIYKSRDLGRIEYRMWWA